MIRMSRTGVALLSTVAAVTACVPSQTTGPLQSATPSASFASVTPSKPLCAELVDAMGPDEQIAQLFMIGIDISGGEIDSATANLLDDTGIGNVLLLGNSQAGVAGVNELTTELRSDARQPGGVELLVAVDQEGGRVQRMQGEGFGKIPSAREQATMSDAELTEKAREWGTALRRAGVDYDLAPVADVVPAQNRDTNTPIGALARDYGSDPKVIKAKNQAFMTGMNQAQIATSVKHFPGLGQVKGNTDLQAEVIDSVTTSDDLETFVYNENADSVMVSSAIYKKLDPGVPAVYSRKIITGTLRVQLDWSGVIISDDLGVAKAAAVKPEVDRGGAFLAAGGDLVINAEPDSLAAMMEGVRRRAAEDEGFASQLPDKATRVLEMKSGVGRASCRPGRPVPSSGT